MHRRIVQLALLCACTGQFGRAQEFKLWNREVQIHGFFSQGFVHTNGNNWLTMNTSNIGSGEFTDFGANASSQITDKFRIGAQIYDRNLGQLGKWHPSLDWAVASYRFKPWLGVRAGKIKTTIGIYNDTQDLEFLRTPALLPQSVYPADLRDSTIAHTGGDVFGDISLQKYKMGSVSYTGYVGHRKDSQYGGYPLLLSQYGIQVTSYGGLQYGGDLRWQTPAKGLLIGASRMNEDITGKGSVPFGPEAFPYSETSKSDWTNQYYAQYMKGKFQVDTEYRRYWRDQMVFSGASEVQTDVRGWYVAGTYRVIKWFSAGAYYSRYTIAVPLDQSQDGTQDTSPPGQHDYDKVVTGRFDINRYLYFKVEGHFMNGYGGTDYPNGFYTQENPNGFQPNTRALVLKTGVSF
jgi:hypothetical protein